MENGSFTTGFSVHESPEEVFAAINDVRAWWSGEIDGVTDQSGAEFTYRYKDVHRSTQRITELIPGRRVAWRVVEAEVNFVNDIHEWNGTSVVFEITQRNGRTEVCFTHEGLVPTLECYDGCSGAWSFYVGQSLRNLIAKGIGEPNPKVLPPSDSHLQSCRKVI